MPKQEITKKELERAKDYTKLVMETPMTQESDLKGVMKEMNEDILEKDTLYPSIDLKTRLHPFELTSAVIHDTVIHLQCLPRDCLATTRIKMRKAVSLKGEGRKEMVEIVKGERGKEEGTGFASRLKGLFTPSQKD